MSDLSESAVPKLVDFGLSKILGPNETAKEPYGTICYVAPEVLKKQPYSYGCDVWSLGVILFGLISGTLPYDNDDDRVVMKMILL